MKSRQVRAAVGVAVAGLSVMGLGQTVRAPAASSAEFYKHGFTKYTLPSGRVCGIDWTFERSNNLTPDMKFPTYGPYITGSLLVDSDGPGCEAAGDVTLRWKTGSVLMENVGTGNTGLFPTEALVRVTQGRAGEARRVEFNVSFFECDGCAWRKVVYAT